MKKVKTITAKVLPFTLSFDGKVYGKIKVPQIIPIRINDKIKGEGIIFKRGKDIIFRGDLKDIEMEDLGMATSVATFDLVKTKEA